MCKQLHKFLAGVVVVAVSGFMVVSLSCFCASNYTCRFGPHFARLSIFSYASSVCGCAVWNVHLYIYKWSHTFAHPICWDDTTQSLCVCAVWYCDFDLYILIPTESALAELSHGECAEFELWFWTLFFCWFASGIVYLNKIYAKYLGVMYI